MQRIGRQEQPGVFARRDDRLVASQTRLPSLFGTQVIPNVFGRFELRCVGRQRQQRDRVGARQSLARLVPTGAIAHHNAVRTGATWALADTDRQIKSRLSKHLLEVFCHASPSTMGMMIAAPTLRAWQMAPNR
jgi:hypothetical protein